MSEFRKKRDALETFVQEQIIGPGAYNKSYFFLSDWETHEFAGKDVEKAPALDNISELLPEVPAYQYSSGILFPEVKIIQNTTQEKEETNTDLRGDSEDEEKVLNTSAEDEKIVDTDSEALVSKQQNYPTSMGLTFVVDNYTNLEQDLIVNTTFRTYKLIKKQECLEKSIAYRIPEHHEEITNAIRVYFDPIFEVKSIEQNHFIKLKKEIIDDEIYDIDYIYLNNYLLQEVVPEFKKLWGDRIKENSKDKSVVYSLDGECDLFRIVATNTKRPNYPNIVTIYDNSVVRYIKTQLVLDVNNYSQYSKIIRTIEIYNQIKTIITNLKSIFKKHQPTPIWESTNHSFNLNIPQHNPSESIFRMKDCYPIDENHKDFQNIQYSLQYILKGGKLYVKILLLNKNSVILEDTDNKQLNKKDEANLKSLFGVKLTVSEKKHGRLLQYNPPQILDFDEEDSFNKLLYRNYIDYGEGYNTSVEWGKQKVTENLRYIATNFLPNQETPLVDYKPSKIVDERVVDRLQDTKVLSMRLLSSLSEDTITDKEIIEYLSSFIEYYKEWIEEKKKELQHTCNIEGHELLTRQLESCEMDYNRLHRNINLLASDSKAIEAFRVMNTAMFMQLHHNIQINNDKDFGNRPLTEDYYKNVSLEKDYEWRSFQLAFVLLNIDAFIQPSIDVQVVEDIFKTGWPERNEITDLVWFPTGGGKTEAYLGIIAFMIAYRRFTKGEQAGGTSVLMRYTLRLLTLQQFQRATMLICALEVMRKDKFKIANNLNLGVEKITIGLFVGEGSLPNKWNNTEKSMVNELFKISKQLETPAPTKIQLATNLPFTNCPWCNYELFIKPTLLNVHPNHNSEGEYSKKNSRLKEPPRFKICCNNKCCTFSGETTLCVPTENQSLPIQLFDDDIYRFPPTLLFGTVDKFAALANNVSTGGTLTSIDRDSRRLVGKGANNRNVLPPELIIQDELHLLLGPLGSAVGLYEKGIDYLCTYTTDEGQLVKPKIITSTATTRNTDKQIFALFNRRAEIFPKQGITCDDSFFAYYKRKSSKEQDYLSNRKYIGVLPIGKTQVWMQLRIASIVLAHRVKYLKEQASLDDVFLNYEVLDKLNNTLDYYHTVLSYFNSLKDVGKTQSQLSHYLPGDLNYITKNTIPWSFLDCIIRGNYINYSELTGRLTGEEVKTNLDSIESKFSLLSEGEGKTKLAKDFPPELVISTNMISVGIDISRFNSMIISSMPRNIAEYIQASSRVARAEAGIVFTIHHPFRSRDISHFQKYKEFHEKFYSYVEPISVTPFANKSLDKYLAMLATIFIRHVSDFNLANNEDAGLINDELIKKIKHHILDEMNTILRNAEALEAHLSSKTIGLQTSIDGVISKDEIKDLESKLDSLFEIWIAKVYSCHPPTDLRYRNNQNFKEALFISNKENDSWRVSHSLREIAPSTVIKTVQQ